MVDRCENGTILIRATSIAGRSMLRAMYAERGLRLRGREVMQQCIFETDDLTAIVLLDHQVYLAALAKALTARNK